MKKEWNTPEVETLELSRTENGLAPSEQFDGDWVQIGCKWYVPGHGEELS
ncbi:hypothetical protein [Waltera intestinalis]|nr:hypothetical protein [Waltera intestinalis]